MSATTVRIRIQGVWLLRPDRRAGNRAVRQMFGMDRRQARRYIRRHDLIGLARNTT